MDNMHHIHDSRLNRFQRERPSRDTHQRFRGEGLERSASPDLRAPNDEARDTYIVAANEKLKSLTRKRTELIKGLYRFSADLKPNITQKSSLSQEQINQYNSLKEDYRLFNEQQSAFDTEGHVQYLSEIQRHKRNVATARFERFLHDIEEELRNLPNGGDLHISLDQYTSSDHIDRMVAADYAFETLKKEHTLLIENFEQFSQSIQPNRQENSPLSEEQFNNYKELVQFETIYNIMRAAFDIAKHSDDLPNQYLHQMRARDRKLFGIRNEAYNTLEILPDSDRTNNLKDFNIEFINLTVEHMQLINHFDRFLTGLQTNREQRSPLSEEQVNTYVSLVWSKDLASRSLHALNATRQSLSEDYLSEAQAWQMNGQLERLSELSDAVDEIAQPIIVAHESYNALRAQRDTISSRFSTLRDSVLQDSRQGLAPSQNQIDESRDIIRLIEAYEESRNTFDTAGYGNSLNPMRNNQLNSDFTAVQEHRTAIDTYTQSLQERAAEDSPNQPPRRGADGDPSDPPPSGKKRRYE